LNEQIADLLKKINPDYDILTAQPIEMRFNEMLEGTKAELSVKIFGNDYDVLEELAEQIKVVLENTPGAAQVEFETEGRTLQLQINAKRGVLNAGPCREVNSCERRSPARSSHHRQRQ
jgi:cobalt-zinc-cadmium resistance protein CzcA